MNKLERKALLFRIWLSKQASAWPRVSELPKADTSDLERAAQYQSTIDAQYEEE